MNVPKVRIFSGIRYIVLQNICILAAFDEFPADFLPLKRILKILPKGIKKRSVNLVFGKINACRSIFKKKSSIGLIIFGHKFSFEPFRDIMKMRPSKAFIFSLINALVMLFLALFWLSLPRTFGDEAFFIKWTSLVKKSVLGLDHKPDPNSVLYVDVSGSKQLFEIPDPFYDELTGYQKKVITNRADLASFLEYLSTYGTDIPIVIIDLLFESPSADDSLLQAAIDHFPFPIVGARKLLEDGQLSTQVIRMPTGVASYLSAENRFMKYPLFIQDTFPSLPLAALEIATDRTFDRTWLWPRIDKHPSLTDPIIDFKIRPIDLNDGTSARENTYAIRSLGTLLFEQSFWDTTDIKILLKNKVIIVGDFKTDIHQTVFGNIPGPLVLHNAYLTLVEGESLIKWRWLLMLFLLFFWMSRRAYLQEKNKERSKWWQASKTAVGKIMADSIDETFFLAIGTILSYFLFNIHINILILLIYLKIVTYLLKRFIFKPLRAKKNAAG